MSIKKRVKLILGRFASYLKNCEEYYNHNLYLKQSGQTFTFVNQGNGGLSIGHPENLKIDPTSHFKSNSFIECMGGVEIGRYFHTGRGLTIFSSNHDYNSEEFIPYGKKSVLKPVVIKDFVWCGANVTICPGVTIEEGAVIGAGAVVTKDVPKCAVVAGNPAKIIKYKDIDNFERLKNEGKFF